MKQLFIKKHLAVLFSFLIISSCNVYAAYTYGDIDNNGNVTAYDAAILLSYVLNPSGVDIADDILLIADVNSDNRLSAADCAEIMAKTLNSAYIMPIEKDQSTSGPSVEPTTSSQTTVTTVETTTVSTTETTTESTTIDLNSIYSNGHKFTIGSAESSLPDASTERITPDGIKWYGYDTDYLHYTRVGVFNGTVVKIVTYDTSVKYDGIHIGDMINNPSDSAIDYSYNRTTQSRLYIDPNDGNRVYSIMLTSRSYYTSSIDYNSKKSQALAMQIADDTNAFRAQLGLKDLIWNPVVASVAQYYAEYMAENSYFEHIDPEGNNPGDRLENAGLLYSYFGENIDAGYYNAEDSMNGWIRSSGHRTNLISENFTQIGVGTAYNPDDTLQWRTRYVQNFYAPL